jgi:O-antigen/teichoic acid export membrane protein
MNSNKRQYIFNIVAHYGNLVLAALLNLISVPIALNYWGKQQYGIWTVITTFTIYISSFGLGIDSATGILMTKNPSVNSKIQLLKKGTRLLCIFAVFGLTIFFILTLIFPNWYKIIGKMDIESYLIAKKCMIIFVIGTFTNMTFGAIAQTFGAFERLYINTFLGTLQQIFTFLIILITVIAKFSLIFYIFLLQVNLILFSLLKLLLFFIILKKYKNENKIIANTNDNQDGYRSILKTGINLTLYGLPVLLVPNLSNLIISNNIGIEAIVPYSILNKLFSLAISFVLVFNMSAAPIYGKEFGNNNWELLQKIYKRLFYFTVSVGMFCVLGVLLLGRSFIVLWTGDVLNYPGDLVAIILACYFFIYGINNLNLIVLNSFNYVSKLWLFSWGENIIFLLVSSIFIKSLGIIAIPIGLVAGFIFSSMWGYHFILLKRTQKRLSYDYLHLIKNILIFLAGLFLYFSISSLGCKFGLDFLFKFFAIVLLFLCSIFVIPVQIRNEILLQWKQKLRRIVK